MIRWKTDSIELQGRLGRLGSIRAIDLWQGRESPEQCRELVATIASLSYGNEAAKDPNALYAQLLKRGHRSCLEFVPVILDEHRSLPLPANSLRGLGMDYVLAGPHGMSRLRELFPATAFLVEAPIFVARQWMRHRSFAYLEMSRRYVNDSKQPWTFYGQETATKTEQAFYEDAVALYDYSIEAGRPPELARRVIPVGAMTRFYAGGFDRDWSVFCAERCKPGAQEETRIFADWIREHIR